MNIEIIRNYIQQYKEKFENVHRQEIYKWHAVKKFQDNFDLNSVDLYSNLETSLSETTNLLDSNLYFPKRMLLKNAEKDPEAIRSMFEFLFDEDFDLIQRVDNFRNDFKRLSTRYFPDANDYQDHRAIMVYLTLRYPERYFFYKFGMFKRFSEKTNYVHRPVKGRTANISLFQNACELIKDEIKNDQELLRLHEKRLDEECYRDKDYNILTQDFIFAIGFHLDETEVEKAITGSVESTIEKASNELSNIISEVDFTPRVVNHIQNNKENKRIGDLGENWVFEHEKQFLINNGKEKLAKKVEHSSKVKGDGLGYDILSYQLDGKPKFIEVKTTKGSKNSTFFITRNELEKSIIDSENFYLYRVYEFDEEKNRGKILKIQGSLSGLCNTPINYKVKLS